MSLKKDFGLRLKELRNKKGITQYQLAELVDIDPKHISHIETGKSFPKTDLIEKLAKALDIDYKNLFFNTESSKNNKILLNKIFELLKQSTYEELVIIYKLIKVFVSKNLSIRNQISIRAIFSKKKDR